MRRLDHAQRPVRELERRDGRVFDRDPLVGQRGRVRGHFDDRAHQPGEQIDAVNRLVHQRAAAVEFPRAAPLAAVVILLRAKPLHVGIAERQACRSARRRSARFISTARRRETATERSSTA